jgi:pimeloyl-ACP methyl ester carboxylesterase
VEANGVTLFYTRSGELPPVLLAHGFSDGGPCWTLIAEALAPAYDLIVSRLVTTAARRHGRLMKALSSACYNENLRAGPLMLTAMHVG